MKQKKTFPYELIGEEVEIVVSKNKSNKGISGKIVDETKATIKIEQNGKIKTLLKNNITLKLLNNGLVLEGKQINKRPEERIKG